MSSNFSKGPFCDYIKDYIKNPSELPDDPEVLKEIIVSQQSITDKLFEQIKLLRLMIYGRKSEKFSDRDHNQGFLFAEQVTEEIADRQIKKDTKIKEHIRRSSNLRKLPDGTPVIEIIHDINEDKKQCGCGAQLVRIGEEKTDRVDIIPARVIAERHIRPKYACPSCEGSGDENRPAVLIAPLPAQLIPKSPVTEGFLAHIMVSKFSDHLPFHRIQKILARMKMNISKSTMCDWAIYISERLQTVYELLRDELMRSECIGCDETTLQVLREPNQRNTKKSYNWTFCGIANNKPVVLMYYQESRSGKFLYDFLRNYEGYFQSDGYTGYKKFASQAGIYHVGCWAHVRREFVKLKKVKPGNIIAREALDMISKLYAVEKEGRDRFLSPNELRDLRQKKSIPVLQEFRAWLDSYANKLPSSMQETKAIRYASNEWPKLTGYTESGHVSIDNNWVESSIRPFVIGRKNWLFSGSPRGAKAAMFMYTLVENAKLNGLEPYWYLRYLFTKIIHVSSKEEIRQLLPQYVDKNLVKPEK